MLVRTPKPGERWLGPGGGVVRIIEADQDSTVYYSEAYRATHSAPTRRFIRAYSKEHK